MTITKFTKKATFENTFGHSRAAAIDTAAAQVVAVRNRSRTLLEHTYRAAEISKLADHVIVAADDAEIFDAVTAFGGNVEMTSVDHCSGTDRAAEVSARHPQYDIVVNVQGDEPEIPGAAIDQAITMLKNDSEAVVATLATPIGDRDTLEDPACVKVVMDEHQRALYFSRAAIPSAKVWQDKFLRQTPPLFFQHIGLYAYRRDFLEQYPALKPSPLEEIESLEQLRILQAGKRISVGLIDHAVVGIDTAKDYELFVSRQRNC